MTDATWHKRTSCRLCDGTSLDRVLALTPTPPANAFVDVVDRDQAQTCYPLDLYFCHDCRHVQLLDIVDPSLLFENYVYVSGTSPVFVDHFRRYADALLSRQSTATEGLAIDVGSNDGTLLKFFQQENWRVLGIDPARDIAAGATAAGINTIAAFLDQKLAAEIVAEQGTAQIITANNVFAHIDDLAGVLSAIQTMLAPEGIFAFEVSYLRDVYEDVLFDTIYHEHLDYHTLGPLVEFFAARGMSLFSAERIDTHGGSIRGYVGHSGGPHQADGSVDQLIAEEQTLGLDQAETFHEFGKSIDQLGQQLRQLLADIKDKGQRIAGFGAPAKATTLMYHFGIGPEIIDYIVDDNPLKQGQFSPGLHIPVVSSTELYADPPDYIVLLAWNFADSIINNHQIFCDGGGQFIVPLPELRVV